jgi:hypothetical protein
MEFENASKNKEAIIKCLGRLVDAGKLHKLSKGKYYKPIKGDHNSIGPDANEIIKDLLVKSGKPIGYITGFNVFNKAIIDTSISNTIQIGRNTFKPTLFRRMYTIEFVLQRNEITNDNIEILQVLDCLKMLKGIPDTTNNNSLSLFGRIIRKYNKADRELLIQLSMKYPASTRALLGLIFETEKIMGPLDKIRETLNPMSTYNLGIRQFDKFLKEKWGIK